MSSEIEYKRIVFVKDPSLDMRDFDNKLYAFVLRGASNVYDADTHRRSKAWQFYAAGWPYQIIQEVCSMAGCTEGGTLKVANNRWTTPENYIKLWRKYIAEARPISELQQRLPIRHVRLYLRDNVDLSQYDQKALDALTANPEWHQDVGYYGHLYYERAISGVETLDEWLGLRHHDFVSGSMVV